MKKSELREMIKSVINEFGPLAAPARGSSGSLNTVRVYYPVKTIKVGDKLKAIRHDWRGIIEKGDTVEFLKIEKASIGNSLVFFIKKNGKLNVHGEPYKIGESDVELAFGSPK